MMFQSKPIKKIVTRNDIDNANKIGASGEKQVQKSDVQAPLPNKGNALVKDISEKINIKSNLVLPENENSLDVTRDTLVDSNKLWNFGSNRRQLVIYNQTARTIKIKIGSTATATSYDLTVNAQKFVVFSPFNFDSIGIEQGTFSGSDINPVMFTYAKGDLAPFVGSLT